MKYYIFIATILMSVATAQAASVTVNIEERIDGTLKIFDQTENNILKLFYDFQNTGSSTYNVRFRLDILESDTVIFTTWSKESLLRPGGIADANLYSDIQSSNLTARARVYYGGEMLERTLKIKDPANSTTEDVFEISGIRAYEDKMRLFVVANKTLSDVIVFAKQYPRGWIIEQARIESMQRGEYIEVFLPYEIPEFNPTSITIAVMTEDGLYYDEKTADVVLESGVEMYINALLDMLSNFFNSVLG